MSNTEYDRKRREVIQLTKNLSMRTVGLSLCAFALLMAGMGVDRVITRNTSTSGLKIQLAKNQDQQRVIDPRSVTPSIAGGKWA